MTLKTNYSCYLTLSENTQIIKLRFKKYIFVRQLVLFFFLAYKWKTALIKQIRSFGKCATIFEKHTVV